MEDYVSTQWLGDSEETWSNTVEEILFYVNEGGYAKVGLPWLCRGSRG